MPETDISKSTYGNLTNSMTDYSVESLTTDAAGDNKETEYQNSNFSQQLGYYKKIPELKIAIDALAKWTIGNGFMADDITTLNLMDINGHGKDTFNSILENMQRTALIGGDAFAEIIKDEGRFMNLKPLDPSVIKIIANAKGRIIRYEQVSKINNKTVRKFKPSEIFHLSRDRVADEIHGVSLIDAVEDIILMRNEAMADYKKLLHRNVCPIRIWKLDTDDTTKIASFKSTVTSMKENFEDIFIPKGSVETEIAAVPANATLNPLPYIQQLNQYFFQACGVPQIIVGGSGEFTEATAKIAYLAFEQTISEAQVYLEQQVLAQLSIEIYLEFPTSLANDVLSDNKKDGMQSEQPMQMQPNDTTAGSGQ